MSAMLATVGLLVLAVGFVVVQAFRAAERREPLSEDYSDHTVGRTAWALAWPTYLWVAGPFIAVAVMRIWG